MFSASCSALGASLPVPSAPHFWAMSSLIGAPPIMILALGFLARTFSMTTGMPIIVVVIIALIHTMSASVSRYLSTNWSSGTSRPRSCTVNPATSNIILTRFLPMSWMSPSTVPMTTVPLIIFSASILMCGRRRLRPPYSASAHISTSGTKYSPLAKYSPTTSIPAARPSITAL